MASDAAYIASFAATAKTVKSLVHKDTHFSPHLPIVQELDQALQRVQATCGSTYKKTNKDEVDVMEMKAQDILAEGFENPKGLQSTISSMLARAEQSRIADRLRAEGRDADLRSFLSCGGTKAGNWLVSNDRYTSTRMDDSQFTIAYALRLGVEPFADIKPDHKCRLCGKAIGSSATHGALCKRGATGTDTCNERHYALNAEIARVLRFLEPSTRVRFEPSIVRHFHKQPFDWKKDARRRGDLQVRTEKENYIVDTSIGLAAAASAPPASNTKAGGVAELLEKKKVAWYTGKFKGFGKHHLVAFCGEAEGHLGKVAVSFTKQRIDWWYDSSDQTVPKSVVVSQVWARLSVALQRANGDGVLNWRYAEAGEAVFEADYDTVHAALNSLPRDLLECDRDLRDASAVAQGAAGGVGGVAAAHA
jgi:hypothetical protein